MRLPSWLSPRRQILIILTAVALGWGAMVCFEAWWYASELGKAEQEVAREQFDDARARLVKLAARWPERAEVEYLLGGCEASLGHIDEAV